LTPSDTTEQPATNAPDRPRELPWHHPARAIAGATDNIRRKEEEPL